MLSRVAENLYWMTRYIERAENTARIIMVNTNLLLDLPRKVQLGWRPIIEILGCEEEYSKVHDDYDERTVLKYLISEQDSPNAITHHLRMARENARTIRDIIPREVWESINHLYHVARQHAASGYSKSGRYDYMHRVIRNTQTITGQLAGTMLHDQGYDFLKMGRNLERGDMTTRIIDVRSADLLPEHEELTPYESIQWMSVLKSLTAYQMYRRRVQERVTRPYVLKFLLTDIDFPRSYFHTLQEVRSCLVHLPRHKPALSCLNEVASMVIDAELETLQQNELHDFLDGLQLGLANLHTIISETYFHNE